MSYDIRFGVKVAGAPDDCYAVIGNPEHDSPTYNLRSMFVKAMDWEYEQGVWYPVTEVLPKVQHGIEELTLHSKDYKKYEPSNGWGTIGSAILSLESIMKYFSPGCWDGLRGSWNSDIPLNCIYMCW